ncbi:unnamed protein product [Pleuronectes platessa]|uniref:Uncharacterized protein n=1 Tax=Pleuronectes platessa TaxID=8262 RepID=A0A9N7YUF0_PLEPL|nr:unnamed protein product [Pleuronectes platessa]
MLSSRFDGCFDKLCKRAGGGSITAWGIRFDSTSLSCHILVTLILREPEGQLCFALGVFPAALCFCNDPINFLAAFKPHYCSSAGRRLELGSSVRGRRLPLLCWEEARARLLCEEGAPTPLRRGGSRSAPLRRGGSRSAPLRRTAASQTPSIEVARVQYDAGSAPPPTRVKAHPRPVCGPSTAPLVQIPLHVLLAARMTRCPGPDETASHPERRLFTSVCGRSGGAGGGRLCRRAICFHGVGLREQRAAPSEGERGNIQLCDDFSLRSKVVNEHPEVQCQHRGASYKVRRENPVKDPELIKVLQKLRNQKTNQQLSLITRIKSSSSLLMHVHARGDSLQSVSS